MDNETKNQIRAKRKDEHIKHFLSVNSISDNGFSDIVIQNNSLPELAFNEITTECTFLKKKISTPLILNAITGGTPYTHEINTNLAMLANKFQIPIAVGSQTIALNNEGAVQSFKIVRETNKTGIVIANLSAQCTYEEAEKAINMLESDAIQLHLNAPQEMCMQEGDRNFKGVLNNIQAVSSKLKVPVIVKETGFGMSYETAKKLYNIGITYIDISGKGGTNFVEIENARNNQQNCEFLKNWGIPTALSLLESREVNKSMQIICSGGITKSEEIVKSLCIGANAVGISGAVLRVLLNEGYEHAEKFLERLIYETKVIMLLLGATNIQALRKIPYLLKGELRELYRHKFV
jgi:isopentenyl-diphosphate delta-isomerase